MQSSSLFNFMQDNSLHKSERICGETTTDHLFKKGKRFISYPLRFVITQRTPDGKGGRILVSVSKRYFKHAVDRNRVKRLIREAYRTHKITGDTDLAIIYISDQIHTQDEIRTALRKAVDKLDGNE